MNGSTRAVLIVLAVALTPWRRFRALRAGSAARPQRGSPPSLSPGIVPVAPAPVAGATPPDTAGRIRAAALVWLLGNLILWPVLFGVPALEAVPELGRLIAGVPANFFLIRAARAAAAAVRRRAPPHSMTGGSSPFS